MYDEWSDHDWPLYAYCFEQLMHEELAFPFGETWYEGADDGQTWIAEMIFRIITHYHGVK